MTRAAGQKTSSAMLLTGGASGIGRHVAGRLLAQGHRLLVTDVNLAALESAAQSESWPAERVWLREHDVRDAHQWQALIDASVAHFGGLDVLWNIAGVVRPGYVHEMTPDDIALHLDTNARGTLIGSQIAARRMVRQRSGHIVNIASMAALAAVPGLALYTASKWAVRGFSLALAYELRPHGVAVTTVCPDAVQTPMLDLQIDYPQAAMTFSGSRPLSVQQVGDLLVGRVLRDRPLEVMLPRSRGWLAKVSSLWPGLANVIAPRLTRTGLARQKSIQARRDGHSSSVSSTS